MEQFEVIHKITHSTTEQIDRPDFKYVCCICRSIGQPNGGATTYEVFILCSNTFGGCDATIAKYISDNYLDWKTPITHPNYCTAHLYWIPDTTKTCRLVDIGSNRCILPTINPTIREVRHFFSKIEFALVGPITTASICPTIERIAKKPCVLDRLTITTSESVTAPQNHYFLMRNAKVTEFFEPMLFNRDDVFIYDEYGMYFGNEFIEEPGLIEYANPLIVTLFIAMAKKKQVPAPILRANLDAATGKSAPFMMRFWGPQPQTTFASQDNFVDEFDDDIIERRRLLNDERLVRAINSSYLLSMPLDALRTLLKNIDDAK